MMKETKKSLKIYFIVVGIINLFLVFLSEDTFSLLTNMLFSGGFVYYGVKMYKYLQDSPQTLTNFIKVIVTINVVFSLINGKIEGLLMPVIVGWYLISNIKKVSQPNIKTKN